MENFKWTDENVKECVDHIGRRFGFNNNYAYPWQGLVKEIEKFKESKQPKPEWEILLCQLDGRNDGSVHTYQPDKCLGKSSTLPPCHIFSVKRLSDGEVFSIGDSVEYGTINLSDNSKLNTSIAEIVSFGVKDKDMWAYGKNGFFIAPLKYLKQQLKPLFTTEDGKDIYVNDFFWYVGDAWNVCETRLLFKGDDWNKRLKAFSTEEAAEQYIIDNKPCLSANDIKWWLENYFNYPKGITVNQLKELVKSKLK